MPLCYDLSWLYDSFDKMTDADNPDGVTLFNQENLPCMKIVVSTDDVEGILFLFVPNNWSRWFMDEV